MIRKERWGGQRRVLPAGREGTSLLLGSMDLLSLVHTSISDKFFQHEILLVLSSLFLTGDFIAFYRPRSVGFQITAIKFYILSCVTL